MGRVYRATQMALSRTGRAEADRAGAGRRCGLPRALRAGVPPVGVDRPPERDPGLRGGRGRRAAVHRHALGGGHRPALPDRERGAPGPGPRRRDRGPDRRCSGRGAQRWPGAPGREARERDAHRHARPGARLPHRLRPDQEDGVHHGAHAGRALRGHPRLHAARADHGGAGRRAGGRLRARVPALPRAHRAAARTTGRARWRRCTPTSTTRRRAPWRPRRARRPASTR